MEVMSRAEEKHVCVKSEAQDSHHYEVGENDKCSASRDFHEVGSL